MGLRPVDRVLGAGFGLIRGAVLLLALAVVVNMSPLKRDEWWTESKGAGVATAALKEMKPVLPERFGQLPSGGIERITCVESSALSAAPQSTS